MKEHNFCISELISVYTCLKELIGYENYFACCFTLDQIGIFYTFWINHGKAYTSFLSFSPKLYCKRHVVNCFLVYHCIDSLEKVEAEIAEK